jgi:phospholipid/cholesterol/gamma-HCH transport system substrate-binding protein
MEKETKQHLRLGIFVTIALGVFLAAIFYIGSQQNLFVPTFRVSTVFPNVSGLQPGSNVWFAGVNVGTVKEVVIFGDTNVWVEMSLEERIRPFVTRDAKASVGSDGLIGNKIVIIEPGTPGLSPIAAGDTLGTKPALDTDDLMATAKTTADNLALITADLKDLMGRINAGEGTLGQLLADSTFYPKFSSELEASLANLRVASSRSASLTKDLTSLSGEIRQGKGLACALLTDSSYTQRLEATLKNFETTSQQVEALTRDLNALTTEFQQENGAVDVILRDSAFAGNLQETMQNLEVGTEKLNETLEAAQHNFLLRGYFKKKEKEKRKAEKQ